MGIGVPKDGMSGPEFPFSLVNVLVVMLVQLFQPRDKLLPAEAQARSGEPL